MAPQGTAIYSGSFRHTLDDKNRVAVPSLWRAMIAEGTSFLALPQTDKKGNRFITAINPEKKAAILALISQIPISNIEERQAIGRYFEHAKNLTLDKQGRVTLGAEHCQHAGIGKDAVFVGSLDNFTIYSPETWERISAPVADDINVLAKFGI